MGAFLDVSKALFIPAAVAATLYALFTYLLLPFYRNHYARYRQYLPLSVNSSSSNTRGLRTRFTDWLVNAMIPNSMRWGRDGDVVRYTSASDPDGTGARRARDSFDSEVYVFGEEEGERLVGFDHERLPRGRDERGGVVEVASDRRLSRELEAGFKDESSEESGDDGRRDLSTPLLISNRAEMYDEESDVEAFIRPLDSNIRYRELKAPPSSPMYTGNPNECYIQAVDGEQFVMVVNLGENFDSQGYDAVRVDIKIDGRLLLCYSFNAPPRGSAYTKQLVSFTDTAEHAEGEDDQELQDPGEIQIMLIRGKRIPRKEMKVFPRGRAGPPVSPEKATKRAATDHGRSHRVRGLPLGRQDRSMIESRHYWTNGKNEAGKPIIFKFFYTSKMFMEIKKIIPPPVVLRFPHHVTAVPSTSDTQPQLPERKGSREQPPERPVLSRGRLDLLKMRTSVEVPKAKAGASSREIISLDSDDEGEKRPHKKIKVEDKVDVGNAVAAGISPTPVAGDITTRSAEDTVARMERVEQKNNLKDEEKREKEKARLRLRLEEIQVQRRLMELDDYT
ncbi:hypothetical protein KC343_g1467 [Hortaea werneckii]|nr:hypothetical protein KC352_g14429 [Hortaea werneckii]KAI7571372.1 hypothetical protein KC317_g1681 [Hortaea werneckii]KAI7624119.1 hypothetical protein KC346_g2372 [Hortaea werneckii]KAI7636065.1 hypothetical protein KC343_g1467 [Hortaea werneckii]KAI7681713.1 hypothetical protein KC319_g1415 [Hortaea werneckii]